MSDDDLALAGQRALTEASRLFHLDVYDPPRSDDSERGNYSRHVIDSILAASGWTWEMPYKGDGQVEWCGLFAAACWRAAGLDPKWLATYFASTYRLDTWARYRTFDAKHPNEKPATGPYRLICNLDSWSTSLPFEPRAGDILMIGGGVPEYGNHITIVESYDPKTLTFTTVSGNGVGLGPDQKRRQGIVWSKAHVGGGGYCARRVIRPALSDLVTSQSDLSSPSAA